MGPPDSAPADPRLHRMKLPSGAEDISSLVKRARRLPADLLSPQSNIDGGQEVGFFKWFEQIAERSSLQRLSPRILVLESGNENDWYLMAVGYQAALQLQPIQPRHLHIQNQARRFIESAGA